MSNRYGITFVLDEHEPQKSILLTSRGGNPIPDLLKLIAKEPGWRLLDGTIGKWIDPNSGSTPGFEAAQKYTEQIKKSDVDKNVDDEE